MGGMQDPNTNSAIGNGNEQNEKEIASDRLIMGASRMEWGVNKSKIYRIDQRIRATVVKIHLLWANLFKFAGMCQMFREKVMESINVAATNAHLRDQVVAQMMKINAIGTEFYEKSINLINEMDKANEHVATLGDWGEGLVPDLDEFKQLPILERKRLLQKFLDNEMHMMSWAQTFEGFQNDFNDMKGKAMEAVDPCIKKLATLFKQAKVSA